MLRGLQETARRSHPTCASQQRHRLLRLPRRKRPHGAQTIEKLSVAEIRKSRERARTKTLALAEQERLAETLAPNIALADDAFLVDTGHQLFSICGTVFRFGSLRGYDLVENKQTTNCFSYERYGSQASRVVQAALFPTYVAGWEPDYEQIEMCYSICVRVRLRDAYVDYVDIPIFSGELYTGHEEYANLLTAAQECMDALQDIVNAASPAPKEGGSAVVSAADEIMKFKQLADMGVITAEEFEAKKKQLLGL